jgi:hypothetical protein
MATIENTLLLQTSKNQEISDSHMQSNFDLDDLDLLRPALDKLKKMRAHHFNPVHFCFIESMAEKALQHRRSVANIIEKKALQALSDYVKEYVIENTSFQKCTASLYVQKKYSQNNKNQGRLAKLTQEMFQSSNAEAFVSKPTLEDELRQQEKDVMHSVTFTETDKSTDNNSDLSVNEQSKTGYNELSIMRHFRQSKVKHNSERLLARTLQEGPEDAGPLNSQALIIRSLTTMRDLSPGYINRLVSYMDTLLWLEQASGEGSKTKKNKNKGRRKS